MGGWRLGGRLVVHQSSVVPPSYNKSALKCAWKMCVCVKHHMSYLAPKLKCMVLHLKLCLYGC